MKNRRPLAFAALTLLFCSTPASYGQALLNKTTDKSEIEFRSGPMQPREVESYLQKMRAIIDEYNGVVFNMVGSGMSGQMPSAQNVSVASQHTQELARRIRSLKAPQEVAGEHQQLAETLTKVEGFIQNYRGAGPAAMPQAMALIGTVQGTMHSYRSGTNSLIRRYGLNPSLDPFGGENAAQKAQAAGTMQSMQQNIMSGDSGGGSGDSGSGGMGGMGGSGGMGGPSGLGSMMSGGSGGMSGMGGLGGLGSMMGGASGAGGAGGMDMGAIMQMLGGGGGGAGGAGGAGGMDMGAIMQMLGGGAGMGAGASGSAGSGGPFGSGGTFGSTGSFGSSGAFGSSQGLNGTGAGSGSPVGDIMKQFGDQQKTMQDLLNE